MDAKKKKKKKKKVRHLDRDRSQCIRHAHRQGLKKPPNNPDLQVAEVRFCKNEFF